MPTYRVTYSEQYTVSGTQTTLPVEVEAEVEAETESLAKQAIAMNIAAPGQVREIRRNPSPKRIVLNVKLITEATHG